VFPGIESLSVDEAMPIQLATGLPRAMSVPGDSDAETSVLTAGMARGDEAAYRKFYDRYYDRLLRYLLVATGDEDSAREALQQTMVRVVRHAHRFDSEVAFWSWLTVLARSTLFDERRKRVRRVSFLDRFFQHSVANKTTAAQNGDGLLLELLEDELKDLTQDERELIEEKYFESESLRDLATARQTSEKAIESRLARIRRKLKTALLAKVKREETK
jgi:RNA polymerase sigma-70 factor (ECF subfamily)